MARKRITDANTELAVSKEEKVQKIECASLAAIITRENIDKVFSLTDTNEIGEDNDFYKIKAMYLGTKAGYSNTLKMSSAPIFIRFEEENLGKPKMNKPRSGLSINKSLQTYLFHPLERYDLAPIFLRRFRRSRRRVYGHGFIHEAAHLIGGTKFECYFSPSIVR